MLVVAGAQASAEPQEEYTVEDAAGLAREKMEQGLSAADAAKEAARLTGLRKGDIYRILSEK